MQPLVSILIPCHNAECWIAQAIESALAQTWPDKEVIVVDDGSTDRSLEIIKRFDGRIRWETGPNRGSDAARNRLLAVARGDWLQYLDADDYLLLEKVARQIEFAQKHPDVDVVFGPVARKRIENGSVVCSETPIPEPRDPWTLLALWYLPQTGGSLWRKEAVESVGVWSRELPCCQEHDLYHRLLAAGAHFEYCPGCFAVYRDFEHAGRITTKRTWGEYVRLRLIILDHVEKHLEQRLVMTQLRRQAINDARHQLARELWPSDRQQAIDTHERIRSSDRYYLPTLGPWSPRNYCIAYRVLGFRGAQLTASYKRALRW